MLVVPLRDSSFIGSDVICIMSSDEFNWAVVDFIQCADSYSYIYCVSKVDSYDPAISFPL